MWKWGGWLRAARPAWGGILVGLVALLANPARAGSPSAEAQFTAAFVFNFAQFVDWPASSFGGANAPLEIGIVSADPGVADSLEALVAGKTLGGRSIAVRRFGTPGAARPCHVIFVDGGSAADVERLVGRMGQNPVLTVGNAASFLEGGGIIRLIREGSRMKFTVNVKAMEQSGLKISSQLLKMASNR